MPSPLTILIAEDNAADRLLLSTIVSRQGHRALTAANGREAVALFQQEQPQLVLMDALMPEMDGFEAARRIKQLAGESLVPIIFLTSLTENDAWMRVAMTSSPSPTTGSSWTPRSRPWTACAACRTPCCNSAT